MSRLFLFLLVVVPFVVFAQDVPAPAPPAQGWFAQLWWGSIFPALITAVTALVTWLAKKAADYFKAKSEEAGASVAATLFNTNMSKLLVLLDSLVADANVRLKPKLASFMADGKLSPEEGAQLKAELLAMVKEKAGPDLLKFIGSIGGGVLDNVLSGLLEQSVARMKPTTPSAEPDPVPPPA